MKSIQRVRIAPNGDIRINRISAKRLNETAKKEMIAAFGNKAQKRKVPNSFLLTCMRHEAELREWYNMEVDTTEIADKIALARQLMEKETVTA